MTKQELIRYSAKEVRASADLFAEYLLLYEVEKGRKPDCSSCSFSSTFNRWKRESLIKSEMKQYDNTFELNTDHKVLYVPGKGEAITANSSDALVIEFLTQEKGKYFEKRAKSFFTKLPDGISKDGKKVKAESEQKPAIERSEFKSKKQKFRK